MKNTYPRHVGILRGLLPDKEGNHYCVCGKVTSDPIHYKTLEIKDRMKELKNWRGMAVLPEDLPK